MDLVAERVEGATLAEQIFQRIRRDLIEGKFQPGQKLKLEQMKADYQIGYSPLREALSRLAERRLVHQHGQRGFRAPRISLACLEDITRTRIQMECNALALAIEQGDSQWEAEIIASHARLEVSERHSVAQDGDYDVGELEQRHQEYHKALLSGCDSPWLMYFIQSLDDQFTRYRKHCVGFSLSPAISLSQHTMLKEFALERDSKNAVQMMEQHIRYSSEKIAQCLPEELLTD